MKYALAVIQFAFAFGLFLSSTIPAFPDNSRFAATNLMAETNYLWIIYLAIGIGIICVGAIVEVEISKWRHCAGRGINQRWTLKANLESTRPRKYFLR